MTRKGKEGDDDQIQEWKVLTKGLRLMTMTRIRFPSFLFGGDVPVFIIIYVCENRKIYL